MFRRTSAAALILWVALATGYATEPVAPPEKTERAAGLQRVSVNGVELHYLEKGSGTPIVFIHGGLADYREWLPAIEKLPAGYRAITYSRRYNFPNDNAPTGEHSAAREADDLAAFLREIKAAPAHVAGASYGAYTALVFALRHPELVRTVIAAEPPLMPWLKDLEGGSVVLENFMSKLWVPVGDAFRAGDRDRALRLTVDYFVGSEGSYDMIPTEAREHLHANLREWEALTTTAAAFPSLTREEAARIEKPVLIVTGEKTYQIAQLIDPELARIVTRSERAIIADGTHDMCSDNPAGCAEAIHAFVSKHAATK